MADSSGRNPRHRRLVVHLALVLLDDTACNFVIGEQGLRRYQAVLAVHILVAVVDSRNPVEAQAASTGRVEAVGHVVAETVEARRFVRMDVVLVVQLVEEVLAVVDKLIADLLEDDRILAALADHLGRDGAQHTIAYCRLESHSVL